MLPLMYSWLLWTCRINCVLELFTGGLALSLGFYTPNLTFTFNSLLTGWGTVIKGTPGVASGRWSLQQRLSHINCLVLKAILQGLQSLWSHLKNCSIKVLCDSTTAVSYIRNMGGSKSRNCYDISKEILLWCMERQLSLSISHLPGKLNTEADKAASNNFPRPIIAGMTETLFSK